MRRILKKNLALDKPAVGAWLLFCQEPTDRALAGWCGVSISQMSEENLVGILRDIVTGELRGPDTAEGSSCHERPSSA